MSPGPWEFKFFDSNYCVATDSLYYHNLITFTQIHYLQCTCVQVYNCPTGNIMRKVVFWLNDGLGVQKSP